MTTFFSRISVGGLIVIALAITWVRIHYGVDFDDESFFVAQAYRYTLGDKPFVHELYMTQLPSSILTYPIAQMHTWFHRSSEGILLTFRICFFLLCSLVGLGLFFWTRKTIPARQAALLSLLPVLFFPWGLPNLSYNTFGYLFLTLGLYSYYFFLSEESPSYFAIISGFFHGLMSFCYLPLAGCVVVLSIFQIFAKRRFVGYYLTGVILTLGVFIVCITPEKILNAIHFTEGLGYHHTYSRIFELLDEFGWLFKKKQVALFIFLFLAIKYFKRLPLVATVLFYPVLAYVVTWVKFPGQSTFYLFHCGVGAGLFYCKIVSNPKLKKMFWLIAPPTVAAGFIMCWTSAVGARQMALPYLPLAILGLIFLMSLLLEQKKELLSYFPVVFSIFILINYQQVFYMDGPLGSLKSKVVEGPYRGLTTTFQKKEFIEGLQKDLKAIEVKNNQILFYPHLPGGYLITSFRPASQTTWQCEKNCLENIKNHTSTDTVVHLKRNCSIKTFGCYWDKYESLGWKYELNDLPAYGYLEIKDAKEYTIYQYPSR